ncbi:MAG: chemotaxis protein CheB [Bacteroidetes bacterium]|nr:chemotaxis protein CheB [Bacteroidota bacterium]
MAVDEKYQAIAIGASAGGLYALSSLFEQLPAEYPLPVMVIQHRAKDQKELLEEVLQNKCKMIIKQADEKEKIKRGIIYIAPPGYHLLVEQDQTLSLSSDELESFSRPSINVLFETAAEVYREKLIGVILTGANSDGASGVVAIRKNGGLTIAQDPQEAQYPQMPQAAIDNGVDHIWTLKEIQGFLNQLFVQHRNEKD